VPDSPLSRIAEASPEAAVGASEVQSNGCFKDLALHRVVAAASQ
jgi:hypothetical protein